MTTKTATSAPQTYKTLRARRHRAEAEIRAVDAQHVRDVAQAEAEAAEAEVERRRAQARVAEQRAQLDELDRFVEQQRQREDAQIRAAIDRQEELRAQVDALDSWKPPQARRSMEEHQADLTALGAYVDRAAEGEREERRRYVDRCESRRLHDPAFRQRWDYHHPGGLDGCNCMDHRAYRGEQ